MDLYSWPSSLQKLLAAGRGRNLLPGLPLRASRFVIRSFEVGDESRRQTWAKFREPHLHAYNFRVRSDHANLVAFERWRDRIRLAIDNPAGELIGYASLKPLKGRPNVAELGLCFAADQVSRGLGRETLRLLLPWACNRLDLRSVCLTVDEVNQRALALYASLGFVKSSQCWQRLSGKAEFETYFSDHPLPSGYRRNGRHLEIQTWAMKWEMQG